MPTTNQTVSLSQGDSLVISIPVLNPDGSKPNLSGATARWWLAEGAFKGSDIQPQPGGSIYIEKGTDSEGGISIVEGTDGTYSVQVTLVPTDTANMTNFGVLYHECQVIDSSGNRCTIAIGRFVIQPTIIRQC